MPLHLNPGLGYLLKTCMESVAKWGDVGVGEGKSRRFSASPTTLFHLKFDMQVQGVIAFFCFRFPIPCGGVPETSSDPKSAPSFFFGHLRK